MHILTFEFQSLLVYAAFTSTNVFAPCWDNLDKELISVRLYSTAIYVFAPSTLYLAKKTLKLFKSSLSNFIYFGAVSDIYRLEITLLIRTSILTVSLEQLYRTQPAKWLAIYLWLITKHTHTHKHNTHTYSRSNIHPSWWIYILDNWH